MPQHSICLNLREVRYSVKQTSRDEGIHEILRGVNLTARLGEVTVLLGPNGAGKTTTLNCAQGLVKPSSGTVELLEHDPYLATAHQRSRVGVMLQDGGLPQSVQPQTLLQHISSFHTHPWPLADLIERLDMAEFMKTSIRRLSGGQKQRVALAASVIGCPDLAFFDEPTAGLDPQSRQLVFSLIEDLRASGMGIVLTTHLLEEAQKLADSVYILKDGKVVRHGTVAELTHTQGTLARRLAFVAERTLTRSEISSAPLAIALDGVARNEPGARWVAEGITTPGDLVTLTRWWEEIDLMPGEVAFESRTLEDVFWEVSQS